MANKLSKNDLFDVLNSRLKKNDAEISRILCVPPSYLSRIRNGRLKLGEQMILRIHEAFEFPISEIREIAKVPSKVCRPAQTKEV